MITGDLKHRIEALSPKAKKLFVHKLQEVLATTQKRANSRKRIVAYIQGDEDFPMDQLKSDLQKKLPDYMVPSQFVNITSMPLLPNGKIDRKKLERMPLSLGTSSSLASHKKMAGQASPIEKKLITLWEEVLGFSPIHRDDNFFEIGGDSILSIQIVAKARKAGITLEPNAVFEHQTIAQLYSFTKDVEENKSETSAQELLIQIWEETLGFSPIHRDDNFFEIGGDSILSIQIIAKARKKGLILRPNDIFEYQSIRELSLFVKAELSQENTKIIEGKIPLSPIQHWFFEVHKKAPSYWNQGVRLDDIPEVTEDQVAQVCSYLITQHDALRARFFKTDDHWIQEISAPEAVCALEFITISENDISEIEQITETHLKRVQSSFDLSKGSLFKCIYFKNTANSQDFCLLIAHHLLVDAVSWQIIIDDFTTALRKVSSDKHLSQDSKTSSFKDWTEYVYAYGRKVTDKEYMFWKSQISLPNELPVDKENLTILEEKDIVQLPFSFDAVTTTELLQGNQTLHTKTEELLITAFIAAIGNWISSKKISIGFERHGRETKGSGLDISKTVGWFTTYFPVQFDYERRASIDEQMIAVKEKMRSIPNGGIGYGALKYGDTNFDNVDYPDIVFNFLGTRRDTSAVDTFRKTILTKYLRDERSERSYKLEVNVSIMDGVLTGAFSFSNRVHNESTIALLLSNFKTQIETICDYCNQTHGERYTPSDFSDTDISQDDLDSLLDILD